MLKLVLEALRERGWFDTSTPFEKTVHLTQAACLWMLLSRQGRPVLYVKFSDCTSLQDEALRCKAAAREYPGLVPRFVGHACEGDVELLVCEAVSSVGVTAALLFGSRAGHLVYDGIDAYFRGMRRATAPAGVASNARFIDILCGFYSSGPLAGPASFVLSSDAASLAADLPAMPQHGDMALVNLGITEKGLVIFDWEDFGACQLPGLDLYVLLASATRTLFGARNRVSWPARNRRALVTHACSAMGLRVEDFDALVPLHALAFGYLKRNYGATIRAQAEDEAACAMAGKGRP